MRDIKPTIKNKFLDFKTLWNLIDTKADNTTVSEDSNGLMLSEDKLKLDGIDMHANNYTHPEQHPTSIIKTTSDARFTSDIEINSIIQQIKDSSNATDEAIKDITERVNDRLDTLSEKQLEILIHLDMDTSEIITSPGYWFDSLKNTSKIYSIDGLSINANKTISGDRGNVTFNQIQLSNNCNSIEYIHELNSNFTDLLTSSPVNPDSTKIEIDIFSYEII